MIKFLKVLCFSLFLTACNLPSAATPTMDRIATEVSIFLTATPLSQITETPELIIVTESNPTIVLTPSATYTDISPSATKTVENSPTATMTPLPTNPAIPMGNPAWVETFTKGTSFGISGEGYDDGNTKIIISDESLTMTSYNVNSWRGWRLASHKPANYYLKADFSVENCAGSDQYGIITQSPDYDSGYGYYFGLTCDGRYSIQKWNENGLTNLDGWNAAGSIRPGSNQANQIGILKYDQRYSFYINESLVSEVNDDYFKDAGYFGPFIAGLTTANFTIHLNDISYWNLP